MQHLSGAWCVPGLSDHSSCGQKHTNTEGSSYVSVESVEKVIITVYSHVDEEDEERKLGLTCGQDCYKCVIVSYKSVSAAAECIGIRQSCGHISLLR